MSVYAHRGKQVEERITGLNSLMTVKENVLMCDLNPVFHHCLTVDMQDSQMVWEYTHTHMVFHFPSCVSMWPKQSSCSDLFRLNLAIGMCSPPLQLSFPIFISPSVWTDIALFLFLFLYTCILTARFAFAALDWAFLQQKPWWLQEMKGCWWRMTCGCLHCTFTLIGLKISFWRILGVTRERLQT